MELFQYDFMKHAFLAVLLISPLFALLGTLIVNNKMAFFSDALGHSALTGVGIGILLGVSNTSLSMAAFGICFALALNQIKRKNSMSTDTIISVFSSLSTAVGLVILSMGGNFSKYSSLLIGDILSVTKENLITLAILLFVTVFFLLFFFNRLHSIQIHRTLAKSRGISVNLYENMFAILLAIVVMFSIRFVGILIINALLILPAAAARNLSGNMREYHLFSIIISLFSGVLGLFLSYYNNTAAGPMIVVIAALVFFGTLLARPYVK